ncbi:MAG: hypothetical protein HYT72_04285 [Candidatus Aenigmarchaeota archaeon]|nr:hypothetical protein [Candidatus Aenigmarchaeota archaeon]
MDFNPVHILYRWANRSLAKDLREARRQRNVSAREAAKAKKDAAKAEQLESENRRLREQMQDAVPRTEYAALAERERQLAIRVTELEQAERERDSLKEPLAQNASLAQRLQRELESAQQQLAGKETIVGQLQKELSGAGEQIRFQRGKVKQLGEELAQTKEESRRRGTIIDNLLQRYLSLYRRSTIGEPPQGTIVAICGRDSGSLIASAQLIRTKRINVGYALQENWYLWLPRLKTRESRIHLPRDGKETGEVITRQVIIIGFYPSSSEAQRTLEAMRNTGVSVTLITDREDSKVHDFVSVRYGSSQARALFAYLESKGIHDEVIERLAALGDASMTGSTEEATYLRDSLYDPTNTGLIRAVVTQLSKEGTLAGSQVYEGVKKRAADYRALQRDGFVRFRI